MRRRVAILTNLFPFPDDTTRGVFNLQQFQSLAAHHDLLVLVPIPFREWKPVYASVHSMGGIEVRYFPYFYPPGFARALHDSCLWLSMQRRIIRAAKTFAPQCVLGCWLFPDGVAAARLARKLNLPLVLKAHGSDLNQRSGVGKAAQRIRAAVEQSASLVVVSQALQARASELGLDTTRTRVIYNGVATEKFRPGSKSEARASLGLPGEATLIVFIGNLKETKGCVDLLMAAPAVLAVRRDVRFCFVGSGSAEGRLRDLARQLRIVDSLVMPGRQRHEQVVDWICASDLVALPSHAEGVPNVLLESMACGRPVVATSVGGIPEVVARQSGVLVAPRDTAALSDALLTALARPWSAPDIRRSVTPFTWQRSGLALAEVIESAIVKSGQCFDHRVL